MPVRIKARFAGNGCSLSRKRNAESRRHSGSRRAAAQAPWAALHSLELAAPVLLSRVLPTTLVRRLSVTWFAAWPTRGREQDSGWWERREVFPGHDSGVFPLVGVGTAVDDLGCEREFFGDGLPFFDGF